MKEIWKKMNLKGHLLTAISYLIPVVCGAGFLVAIGMALEGSSQSELIQGEFSFQDALAAIGGTALGLLPVTIATGVSFSIAGKPGIAPGLVVGLSANAISAGFIDGMVSGYIAGFLALWILKSVRVSDRAEGPIPTVIVPLLTSLIPGLLVIYVIGILITAFTNWLTNFLQDLGSPSMLILGLVIGTLNIVDFGRPINKVIYAFTLTLLTSGVNEPVTALQLINTSTPIEFGLAYFIAKLLGRNIYDQEQIENLKSAIPMEVLNIVEGAIPIITDGSVRGITAAAVGGVAGDATSMVLDAGSTVPFGGFLMLPTMTRPQTGLLAIIANVVVTDVVYALITENETAGDFASENDINEEKINLTDIEAL